MAYKLAVLEILRIFFVLAYIACPRYLYIWSLLTLILEADYISLMSSLLL